MIKHENHLRETQEKVFSAEFFLVFGGSAQFLLYSSDSSLFTNWVFWNESASLYIPYVSESIR